MSDSGKDGSGSASFPAGFEPSGAPASDGIHYIEKLAEGTWRIDESSFVNCYLLEGTDRALLIDTGVGLGNIRETAQAITSLPLDVVATHRHCDHVGGAPWFDACYVHQSDLRNVYTLTGSRLAAKILLRMGLRMLKKAREKGAEIPADIAASFSFNAPKRGVRFVGIDETKVFHLGERDVSVVNVPGHTRGSIVLLDEREKLMFTGDDANLNLWMQLPGCTSLAEWVPGCECILALVEDYVAYGGHSKKPLAHEQIAHLLGLAEELIASRKNTLVPHTAIYPAADAGTGAGIFPGAEVNITYNTRRVH